MAGGSSSARTQRDKDMFLTIRYGGMEEAGTEVIDVFICRERKKSPTHPRGATSSRPSGAAATLLRERMRSRMRIPADHEFIGEPVSARLPDWTPPQMAGFLFLGIERLLACLAARSETCVCTLGA